MNILLVKKYSSSQKQIIEKSKFILSPLGEVFAKQTETIQDRRRKQLDASIDLNDSKKILIKAIEDKPKDKKDQSITADIFNDLILKKKIILNELYDNCDLNKLHLKYERSIKDENFNVYYSFKERFDRRKSQNFKFDYVVKKLK